VCGPIFVAVYAVALWLSGVVTSEEIGSVWRDVRRLTPGSNVSANGPANMSGNVAATVAGPAAARLQAAAATRPGESA
jgi:hypothetical protein